MRGNVRQQELHGTPVQHPVTLAKRSNCTRCARSTVARELEPRAPEVAWALNAEQPCTVHRHVRLRRLRARSPAPRVPVRGLSAHAEPGPTTRANNVWTTTLTRTGWFGWGWLHDHSCFARLHIFVHSRSTPLTGPAPCVWPAEDKQGPSMPWRGGHGTRHDFARPDERERARDASKPFLPSRLAKRVRAVRRSGVGESY